MPRRATPETENTLDKAIVDAIPSPVFVVDDDVRILFANPAAVQMLGKERTRTLQTRAGELLHCVHAAETPDGCGHTPACRDCVVRGAVNRCFAGEGVARVHARLNLLADGAVSQIHLLVTAAPLSHGGFSLALLILEDVSELMRLRGLLPICAKCKKVRDDEQYWHDIADYFNTRMEIEFTHGLCPDCVGELYPGVGVKHGPS